MCVHPVTLSHCSCQCTLFLRDLILMRSFPCFLSLLSLSLMRGAANLGVTTLTWQLEKTVTLLHRFAIYPFTRTFFSLSHLSQGINLSPSFAILATLSTLAPLRTIKEFFKMPNASVCVKYLVVVLLCVNLNRIDRFCKLVDLKIGTITSHRMSITLIHRQCIKEEGLRLI